MKRARSRVPLETAIATLNRLYPASKPLTDPLSILVWENIGYLIDDERRAELFAEFKTRIGLTASQIANAPRQVLSEIAKRGGMRPLERADRLIEIGRLTMSECGGDLRGALRRLPLAKAHALLRKFPSIGNPGADRIILFAGVAPLPCLDSNGLRALIRLGYCEQHKSYAQTYKSGTALLASRSNDGEWLKSAYILLREHGRTLCKRAAPICEPCPLDKFCMHRATSNAL
jgi:endonuclease-3